MAEAFEALLAFCDAEHWQATRDDTGDAAREAVSLRFGGDHGQWTCHAQVHTGSALLIVHSVCPVDVPPERRLPMAEFLTRANYGLSLGNFELGLDDGALHFKTGLDFEGDRLTPALVKGAVYPNVITMDRYLPGIRAVIAGASPRDALAAVESAD